MFKVKPQNPILLIVFDAAFAKVEYCCRWVHHSTYEYIPYNIYFNIFVSVGRLVDWLDGMTDELDACLSDVCMKSNIYTCWN